MKKTRFNLTISILLLTATLLASACGGAGGTGGTSTPIRVAVVMPSSITDMAFSQSMYNALKAVQTEMGGESAMELKYSENMFNVPDAAAAIRDYASQGFDIVIAHGSQYGSSVEEIAPDFQRNHLRLGHRREYVRYGQCVCLHSRRRGRRLY